MEAIQVFTMNLGNMDILELFNTRHPCLPNQELIFSILSACLATGVINGGYTSIYYLGYSILETPVYLIIN